MRVWLVDEQAGEAAPPLEPMLRQLAERAGGRMTLLGSGPLRPGLVAELRGWQLDLLIIRESCWPDGPEAQALLDLEVGLLVVAAEDRCERLLPLAEAHPLAFVVQPGRPEDLWPALLGTLAARRRHANDRAEVARLQQRLSDRIVIERAKGVLVQRLGITEEDAYKRMRVISRRQRRPIRDIAQSLLDAESLLLPEVNGCLEAAEAEKSTGEGTKKSVGADLPASAVRGE
jgi:AmiR/NasT family two-component response regulator